MRFWKQFPGTRLILRCCWLSWYMLAVCSRDPERKYISSYYQRTMSTLDQSVWFLFAHSETSMYMFFISAADDVFVRKDLLKTKYDFVDFAGAEKYHNWCTHYSQCTLSCQTISMKMTSLIETPKTNWDPWLVRSLLYSTLSPAKYRIWRNTKNLRL